MSYLRALEIASLVAIIMLAGWVTENVILALFINSLIASYLLLLQMIAPPIIGLKNTVERGLKYGIEKYISRTY